MNLIALLMIIAGGVLIYAAMKNKSPIEIVREALTGSPTTAENLGPAPVGKPDDWQA